MQYNTGPLLRPPFLAQAHMGGRPSKAARGALPPPSSLVAHWEETFTVHESDKKFSDKKFRPWPTPPAEEILRPWGGKMVS